MIGKLYRRYSNGCIYEVIEQAGDAATSSDWTLYNERFAERVTVTEAELSRQVGWDLVGRLNVSGLEETDTRMMPAALMK